MESTLYLFYIITKQTTTDKTFLFQNLPLVTLVNTKTAIYRNLLSILLLNEAMSLIA